MKILLISNMYPSKNRSYYGSFVKTFEDSLSELGCDFSNRAVLTKTDNTMKRLIKYIFFYFRIFYYSIFGDDDLIYVHYVKQSAFPFIILSRFVHKNIVFNSHGSDLFSDNKRLIPRYLINLARKCLKYCDKLVVPSNFYKNEILKLNLVTDSKIIVSPSGGINMTLFKYSLKKNKTFTLGYLGRIDAGKGLDTLISAMEILNSHDVNLKLIIGGDGLLKNKYEQEVNKKGLNGNIIFLGFINHKEVSNFHKNIDVLIFPSKIKKESLGLSPIEALACGVPVIANRNGAVEDYIIDGENGFLYNNDDVNELANLIFKSYKLQWHERIKMSKNARIIGEKYDSKIVALELYENLKLIS